jgi:hypothetical protein
MIGRRHRIIALIACIAAVSRPNDAAVQDRAGDSKAIEGLWIGFWGGGRTEGGAELLPARAELFVQGDDVELYGFRNVRRLTGRVRLEPRSRRMEITPRAEAAGQPASNAVAFVYELKDDTLTLTGSDQVSVPLHRQHVVAHPLGNAQVELLAAAAINDAGDLLVTEFTELRAGRMGAVYYQPRPRKLQTRDSTVLRAQDGGLKRITIDEARGLIRDPTPVVVAFRPDDHGRPPQLFELWKEVGSPVLDGDAVARTFSRILRPGTLVFILSARENVLLP